MKHVELWAGIAAEAGVNLAPAQLDLLSRYLEWLASEAGAAGGIGPAESSRLADRHIGDSLLFLHGLPTKGPVLDVGTGVGLPGIPLAIAVPDSKFILLDRSGRRVDLLDRARRILELPNVEVVQGDIEKWDRPVPAVVSRASLAPAALFPWLEQILEPEGVGIVGGSWHSKPQFDQYEIREITSKILAQTVWILIMRRT